MPRRTLRTPSLGAARLDCPGTFLLGWRNGPFVWAGATVSLRPPAYVLSPTMLETAEATEEVSFGRAEEMPTCNTRSIALRSSRARPMLLL